MEHMTKRTRIGRTLDCLRPWKITCDVLGHAEGSAMVESGGTRVICAASVEERVPPFLKNEGRGWVTAEDLDAAPGNAHSYPVGAWR